MSNPNWGPIGEDIFYRTYSRVKQDGTKETWDETVKRVVDGNLSFVDPKYIESDEREKLIKLITDFSILPSGRHLFASGTKKAAINNCFVSGWNDYEFTRHFTFTFMRLAEGGGVGSPYDDKYFETYSMINSKVEVHFVCDKEHKDYEEIKHLLSKVYSSDWPGAIQIDDSREGWRDAIKLVIDSSLNKSENKCVVIPFDVSHIRPKGAKLKTFGGSASGPIFCMQLLKDISERLSWDLGHWIDWRLAMDIDHYIATAVVAGSSRRSARLASKYWKDTDIFDFIHMKDDGKSHWSANISVVIDNEFIELVNKKDEYACKILRECIEGAITTGEPGLLNATKSSEGELNNYVCCNPCGEVTFSDQWDVCCISNVNLENFVDSTSYNIEDAFRLVTRFLIRATFSDKYDEELTRIVEKNRRIGVGFTGFQGWLNLRGIKYSDCHKVEHNEVHNTLMNWYSVIRTAAREYAFQLRIPEPIKVTSIQPNGTVSKLPGVSEGLHPIFAKYYIRRVIFSDIDPEMRLKLRELEESGHVIVDSSYTPNAKVVEYVCEDVLVNKMKIRVVDLSIVESGSKISLINKLSVQRMVQECFADNAISYTCNIKKDEYSVDEVIDIVVPFLPYLKGITLMPDISNRAQMPYEEITEEQYIASKNRMVGQVDTECKNNSCPVN